MKAGWKKVTSFVLAAVLGISGIFAGVPQETFAAQTSVAASEENQQAETLTIHFKSPWNGANISRNWSNSFHKERNGLR